MSATGIDYLYQEEFYKITSKIVIVLDKEWLSLSEEEKALLNKILGSVKTPMAAAHIITRAEVSLEALQFLSPSRILIFGSQLQEEIQAYENVTIKGIEVIQAHLLSQLDDNRKKSLWLALKQMFKL